MNFEHIIVQKQRRGEINYSKFGDLNEIKYFNIESSRFLIDSYDYHCFQNHLVVAQGEVGLRQILGSRVTAISVYRQILFSRLSSFRMDQKSEYFYENQQQRSKNFGDIGFWIRRVAELHSVSIIPDTSKNSLTPFCCIYKNLQKVSTNIQSTEDVIRLNSVKNALLI